MAKVVLPQKIYRRRAIADEFLENSTIAALKERVDH
jgi:hypothetical protein